MVVPATHAKEDNNMKQDTRTRIRARDSRGRPVAGLYVREGRFIAGAKVEGRWTMRTLDAQTLTGARYERESWLAGLREGRIAAPSATTFAGVFADWQASRPISERTQRDEQQVAKRLAPLMARRVQEISSTEIARLMREHRQRYAPWTCVHTFRILAGTFGHAARRGILSRNPLDGIAKSERPKQHNKRRVARLDSATVAKLVDAGRSERWRAALGLAGYAGLRLGEVRGLRWQDVDLDAGTIIVRRSLLPDGTEKQTKTEAGERMIPLLPGLRRLLVEWKLRATQSKPSDLVIGTADGKAVSERNVRRAFNAAKTEAGLDGHDDRVSMHALRHSYASLLATDLELPATTLAELIGHTDAGFTLRVYARDARDTATVVADVLARAERAGIGS
jgi:integrase